MSWDALFPAYSDASRLGQPRSFDPLPVRSANVLPAGVCLREGANAMHATRRARSTDAAQCGCCRLAARTMQGSHRPASAGSSIRRVGVLAPAPLPQRSMDVPVASHGLSPPKAKSGARVLLAVVAGVSPAYTRGVRECYGRCHVCLLSNPLSDARLSRDNAVTAQRRGDVTCVLSLRAVCESWERNACNQPSLRTALFWCPPHVP